MTRLVDGELPPLAEIHRALRAGELTAVALIEHALARHDAFGDRLGAYRELDADGARAQASAIDRAIGDGRDPGPLAGVPISVKDLYGVEGTRTFAGTPKALPPAWEREGPLVAGLRRQGGVILGKTHTVELAFGGIGTNPHHPTPRNPWDAEQPRAPGGSSSGAGVSLAEGSAALALGTDTAGSVRIPASWTGNVGLKVTHGRWSTDGIVPLSPTLDTPGVLARTVADVAWAFAAIEGLEPSSFVGELERRAERPMRLAAGTPFFWTGASPGVTEAVLRSLEQVTSDVITYDEDPFVLPEIDEAFELFLAAGPVAAELNEFLSSELPEVIETLDPNVRQRLGSVADLPAREYLRRLRRLRSLAASADDHLATIDALVTPTVAMTPPTLAAVADAYPRMNLLALRNTGIVNYLGLCALTLPVAVDLAAMPVGLQLIGRAGAEESLLALALALERSLGTARERLGIPPMVA